MGFAAPVSLPTIDASDFAGGAFLAAVVRFRANPLARRYDARGRRRSRQEPSRLQLAVAGLTGAQWLGMNAQRGPILYLSAEDEEDEIHRRLDRIITAQGCSYSDLKA